MRVRWVHAALVATFLTRSLYAGDELPPASPAPAGGQPVIAGDWRGPALDALKTGSEFGTSTPSDAGLVIRTTKLPKGETNLAIRLKNTASLAKGQPVLLRFAARSLKAAEMTGQTQVGVMFEKASPDWFKSIQTSVQPRDQWQRFDLPFKVLRDYKAGEASMNFTFGFSPQTVELADVQLIAYAVGTDLGELPRTQPALGEPDAKLYDSTIARIGQYRALLDRQSTDAPVPTPGRTLHVSATAGPGGDGSAGKPFTTIQAGVDAARPGDTVLVAAGVYDRYAAKSQAHTRIAAKGRPDAWIAVRAAPGPRPKIVSPLGNAVALLDAHYVEVKGFEIEGVLSPISKNAANGVAVRENSTHVRIVDNVIHGFGGGGVYSMQSDYLHFEGNVVYHNSHGSDWGNSGISVYGCVNSDDAPGYHNVIRRNIAYDNENTRPFRFGGGQITDGNGIIMDDNRHTQKGNTGEPYRGWTLIENNLIYGNGGRGIHSFLTDHVDVINNTIYMNQHSHDVQNGEMTAIKGDGFSFFNNVVVTLPDLRANSDVGSKNVVFGRNFFFNTEDFLPGKDAVVGRDPLLRKPSEKTTDPEAFRPRVGSPLLGAGLPQIAPKDDLFGKPRTGATDLGAIQGAGE